MATVEAQCGDRPGRVGNGAVADRGERSMITVTVCVGSSCHLKGAREVIERFDGLLKQHGLKGEVALKGAFCMDRCAEGLNWQIDDEPISSATKQEAIETFRERILVPMGVMANPDPKGGTGS